MRILGWFVRRRIRRLQPINGRVLLTEVVDDRYIVYCYTKFWPAFIHANGTWFENSHEAWFGKNDFLAKWRNTFRPDGVQTVPLSIHQMQILAEGGVPALTKAKLTERDSGSCERTAWVCGPAEGGLR